ncbi:MAG: peptidoglycan-associated lipoprotein Pal [Chlorobiaceae bacterium]|nr:peptidoglycan-associated lipoprotein Pal [Chlorobiaceae bacterium]
MNIVKPLFRSLLIPSMLFIGACCGEKAVVETPKPLPPPPPVVTATLGDIFFDFDRSEIRAEARDQLQTNYHWLEENASRKVIIEGHCDERGTNEYNLALGERRANSAKDYLINLGAAPGRLNTVSYGEEKPFASGHNEEAWAQNRRDHFVAE